MKIEDQHARWSGTLMIYTQHICAEKVARLAEVVYTTDGLTMELVNTSEHLVFTVGLNGDPTASF